ncbi:MAG: gamma-glutamylcyclotransferase [Alphaproteobacteria bacterium]|nr:gamma-glutamylcyclotransferase [Alphaproteobacteria bacterium]
MSDYFFYGSLMDIDILSAVTGERIEPARLIPARLAGFARLRARNSVFSLLVESADEREPVAGFLVRGLGPAAAKRLDHYESNGYVTTRRRVETATGAYMANIYVPARPGRATGQSWDFEEWKRRHKRRLLRVLKSGQEERGE